MNNDDERDYAEEAANARDMRGESEPVDPEAQTDELAEMGAGRSMPDPELAQYVPPEWVPPSEQLDTRMLAAGVYVVAAAVGLALDPTLTFDELGEAEQRAWEAIVRRAQLGTWCVDCLVMLVVPWQPIIMTCVTDLGAWRYGIGRLEEIHARRRDAPDNARDFRFSTVTGDLIGVYAVTVHSGEPVCEQHFRIRSA